MNKQIEKEFAEDAKKLGGIDMLLKYFLSHRIDMDTYIDWCLKYHVDPKS